MRRVLLILNLASLSLLLVGWAFSFYRQPVVIVRGYDVSIDGGEFWLAGPETLVTETRVHLERPSTNNRALESVLLGRPRRWIPIRRTGPYTTYWIVEAWFVALVLALPAVLLWRGRRRHTAPGFEVQQFNEGMT